MSFVHFFSFMVNNLASIPKEKKSINLLSVIGCKIFPFHYAFYMCRNSIFIWWYLLKFSTRISRLCALENLHFKISIYCPTSWSKFTSNIFIISLKSFHMSSSTNINWKAVRYTNFCSYLHVLREIQVYLFKVLYVIPVFQKAKNHWVDMGRPVT